MIEPKIINRGRGPEIEGTRITVFDILDYAKQNWHRDQIALWFRISSAQVVAALEYIEQHKEEVLAEYEEILERCRRGNPPELQAKLDKFHEEFLAMVARRKAKREAGVNDPTPRG